MERRGLSLQIGVVLLVLVVGLCSLFVGLLAAYRQAHGLIAWPFVVALVPLLAGLAWLWLRLVRQAEAHASREANAHVAHAWQQREQALAVAGIVLWEWDETADRLTWSDNAEEVVGRPATRADLMALVAREDRARLEEALRTQERFCVKVRLGGESRRWVQVAGRAFRDHAPGRVVGTVLDVTGRQPAEEVRAPAVSNPVAEPPSGQPEVSVPQLIGRPLHVLVVEDNPINQMVLTMLLDRMGCTHTTAENGHQAVLRTESERYDLILMDVQMPEMDGVRATKLIRAQQRGSGTRTPIVAVTANAGQGEKDRCLAAGMDDYLSKPVRGHDLLPVIGRLFSGARPARESGPAAPEWLPAMTAVGLDRAAIVRLARTFRETVPSRLGALRAALEQRDGPLVARTAHTLKGSFTAFASQGGVAAAAEVEERARGQDFEAAEEALLRLEAEGRQLMESLVAYEEGESGS